MKTAYLDGNKTNVITTTKKIKSFSLKDFQNKDEQLVVNGKVITNSDELLAILKRHNISYHTFKLRYLAYHDNPEKLFSHYQLKNGGFIAENGQTILIQDLVDKYHLGYSTISNRFYIFNNDLKYLCAKRLNFSSSATKIFKPFDKVPEIITFMRHGKVAQKYGKQINISPKTIIKPVQQEKKQDELISNFVCVNGKPYCNVQQASKEEHIDLVILQKFIKEHTLKNHNVIFQKGKLYVNVLDYTKKNNFHYNSTWAKKFSPLTYIRKHPEYSRFMKCFKNKCNKKSTQQYTINDIQYKIKEYQRLHKAFNLSEVAEMTHISKSYLSHEINHDGYNASHYAILDKAIRQKLIWTNASNTKGYRPQQHYFVKPEVVRRIVQSYLQKMSSLHLTIIPFTSGRYAINPKNLNLFDNQDINFLNNDGRALNAKGQHKLAMGKHYIVFNKQELESIIKHPEISYRDLYSSNQIKHSYSRDIVMDVETSNLPVYTRHDADGKRYVGYYKKDVQRISYKYSGN